MPCVSLASTLLRDRQDVISDLVELHWVKDPVSPGTGVEIYVTDFVGKKHSVYASNGADFAAAARREAQRTRDLLQAAIP